jgi:hypothetical protein
MIRNSVFEIQYSYFRVKGFRELRVFEVKVFQ